MSIHTPGRSVTSSGEASSLPVPGRASTLAGAGTDWRARLAAARLDALLLVLVLTVGIFFRFYQLDRLPPGMDFDEAFESMQAHRLVTEPGYHPIFFPENNGVPPVKIYLTALAFLIGGEDRLSIRYVSAVTGVLTILALYVLARRMFPLSGPPGRDVRPSPDSGLSKTPATPSIVARRFLPAVACLLLAMLPWHVTFSRHGIEVILLPLWAVLAILFLWLGLESGRLWPFAVSGLCWGSVFYTYQAGWLLPGVLVVFLAFKIIQERGFLRRSWRGLLLLALTAILVLLPLAAFVYRNQAIFLHRTSQVGVFAQGQGSSAPLLSLLDNARKVAGLFVWGGDIAITDNIALRPPLPLILALVLGIGILVALRRIRRPEYALLLIWFVWMLLPSVVTENAPSIRRAIGSVPALVLLMALGLAWVFDLLSAWSPLRNRRQTSTPPAKQPASVCSQWSPWLRGVLSGVCMVVLLAYSALWGYRYYFVEWANGKDLFHFFDVGLVKLGQYAATTPADTRLYYSPANEGDVVHVPMTWQIRERTLHTFDGQWGLVLPPPAGSGTSYLVTTFLGDSWSLPVLRALYPTGSVSFQVNNLYGVPHSYAYSVPGGIAPDLHIQHPVPANFAGELALLGADLSAPTLRAGDTLTVTLYWQATAGPTPYSHTVFTHLLGPAKADGSSLWAGRDSPPVGGSYSTVRWTAGETILDRHALVVPDKAPSAVYQVEVGLYTPDQAGARLPVLDAAGQAHGDSVVVAPVTVNAR
jgi:hypothetical protein